MNTENLNYLKDAIRYHGFGEKLHADLENHIATGEAHFQLRFAEPVNGKSFEALLSFRRGDNSDMYYFNSYKAKLDRGIRENIEHTFYINKGRGITAKEAYNLLDGRSVYKAMTSKEGASYQAWLQLDAKVTDKTGNAVIKQYHDNYGFELGKSLALLPIKELGTGEEKLKLMHSLEKGNRQAVTFVRDGKQERMFLEANPQYKTLTVYDGSMKRIRKSEEKTVTNTPAETRRNAPEKQTASRSQEKPSAKRKAKPTEGETGLIPKKRVSPKKGLTP